MKHIAIFSLLAISCSLRAENQDTTVPDKTLDTFVIGRIGFYTGTGETTYRYAEVFETYGKWIPLDVYYIDFGGAKTYRETAVGGGRTLYDSKQFTMIQEVYVSQATGPAAHGALYVQTWSYIVYHPNKLLSAEAVYLLYIPVNSAGRVQHVIERAKVEHDFGHFKLGGGYAAYQFGDGDWQNKPMITTTLKAGKLGSFEFWLQKMPTHGAQVQVRYAKFFKGHK